jgi:hypothetical protein
MRLPAGRALSVPIAAAVAVTALAGCGSSGSKGPGTLSSADLTVGVKAALAQKFSTPPKSVVCPHGLLASQGATTSCTITGSNGDQQEVLVTATTIVGNKLNYTLKLGDKVKDPKTGQAVTGKTS